MKVALLSMPFNSILNPSLQIGLLKAVLEQHGIEAQTWHLNLELARQMGFKEYETVGNPVVPTVGEWLASYALFGDLGSELEFMERWKETFDDLFETLGWTPQDFLRVRRELIPAFLDWCMDEVPWREYDLVGFTSTYQQQIISLALAKRVKEKHPHIQIVFGGANNIDPMGREHFRAWPWIDHICLGEGDHTLPELVKRLADGGLGDGVRGFISRVGDTVLDPGPAPMFMDMDALPDPDYDEYFARAVEVGFDYNKYFPGTFTALPMETARGCWWGAKNHCTFCGLPALGMKFRSRSVPNVLAQLDRMSRRYRTWHFAPVDNIIDKAYIKELFGAMADAGYDYQLWYESKANVTSEQLRLLRNGGLTAIQPGIESLSANVLRIMDKGVTGLVNVNTIRWSNYYGISVTWNIIAGFPGETPADYAKLLDTMKKIVHLEPPGFCGRIWLQRFSPYFEHPERYPISQQRPFAFYGYVYPGDRVDLTKVAYWFEYQMEGTVSDEIIQTIKEQVKVWQERWRGPRRPELFYLRAPGRLQVVDARGESAPVVYELTGDTMDAFEFCMDKPHNLRTIAAHLDRSDERTPDELRARGALRFLVERGIVLEEEGYYLSIALPIHRNTEPHPVTVRRSAAPLGEPVGAG